MRKKPGNTVKQQLTIVEMCGDATHWEFDILASAVDRGRRLPHRTTISFLRFLRILRQK